MPNEIDLQEVLRQNLRVLLAMRRMTHAELASLISSDRSTIAKRMNGHRDWSLQDLAKLAEVFGVTAQELIGDTSQLVNVAAPARTGTDSVTRGNTRRYAAGNGARIIQFPQRTGPHRRYRARKSGPAQRIGATTRAAANSSHLTAAAAG